MADTPKYTAQRLNDWLAAGGVVQVTTCTKSWLYSQKHAGWFTEDAKGSLYVRSGRGRVCLGTTDRPCVGLRLGRPADAKA